MLRFLWRLFLFCVVLLSLWLVTLAIVGEVGSNWVSRRVQEKLSQGLGAEVKIGGVDIGLVRGRFEVAQMFLSRKDIGAMRIEIEKAYADTAPLGFALFERDRAYKLTIDGLVIELSSWAVLAPPPGSPLAFHVEEFDFSRVELLLAPTLLLPGAGSVELKIDRAKGGATTLRSAVSWLFSIEELDARVGLPGGATATVKYRGSKLLEKGGERKGTLTLGSSLLDKEVTIPLTLPSVVDGDELSALRQLGARITKEVTKNKAVQMLKKLWP
jgi:hypothetical protein